MTFKLIAIDLDDTLLDSSLHIPARVSGAITKAVDLGIYIVLCTGRILKGSRRFYDELGLKTAMITTGGAEIYDGDGRCLYRQTMDPAIAKELVAFAQDNGVHFQVYIDGDLVYHEKNKYLTGYENANGFKGVEMPGLLALKEIHTPKILLISDPERMNDLQTAAKEKFPMLNINRSKPTYLEFSSPGVSKGDALKFVAQYYGIKESETIAIGDAEIDIPMIKAAGLGVAVANATLITKQAAGYICPSNDEGGVADVIEKFILEAQNENQAQD